MQNTIFNLFPFLCDFSFRIFIWNVLFCRSYTTILSTYICISTTINLRIVTEYTLDSCFVIILLDLGLDFFSIGFPVPGASRTFGLAALTEIPRVYPMVSDNWTAVFRTCKNRIWMALIQVT